MSLAYIVGDALLYTGAGLRRAAEVCASQDVPTLLADARGQGARFSPPCGVVRVGWYAVAQLRTREGFELRATPDLSVYSETRGWVQVRDLRGGEAIRVANRGGAFGTDGSYAEGQVLGWLVAAGHLAGDRAVLRFEGEARGDLAEVFAAAVNTVIRPARRRRTAPVGLVEARDQGALTLSSSRLREFALCRGWDAGGRHVPEVLWGGTRPMQVGFLQALFEADAQVVATAERAGLRLRTKDEGILRDVQRMLLNFGLFSRVAPARRSDRPAAAPHRAVRRPLARGSGRSGGGAVARAPRAAHQLLLSAATARQFGDAVGFLSDRKRAEMASLAGSFIRRPYRERFVASVEAVAADGSDWVYAVRAPTPGATVANGLLVAASERGE